MWDLKTKWVKEPKEEESHEDLLLTNLSLISGTWESLPLPSKELKTYRVDYNSIQY